MGNRTIKFSQLSPERQRRVVLKMARSAHMLGRGSYDIVHHDSRLRRTAEIEMGGEDDALDSYRRGRMLGMARQGMRNGAALPTVLNQIILRTVGIEGGKASFAFGSNFKESARALRELFSQWAASCEFHDGLSLNTVMRLVTVEGFLGGDCVVLFDDDLIADSGKLIIFESDEIGEMNHSVFAERFGKRGYKQVQGRIYNSNGVFVGVVVSASQRGQPIFRDSNDVFVLGREPFSMPEDTPWVMMREVWRPRQGRGVSRAAPTLGPLLDIEDTTKFEIQAAKINAQTVGQIISNAGAVSSEDEMPALPTAGFNSEEGTEEGVSDLEGDDPIEEIRLDHITEAGAYWDEMPEGVKLELLDTKRPNPNMPEFINWLSGRSAAAFGLSRIYATLHAETSYTAFRGEQILAQPAFEDRQKYLENNLLDWVARRFVMWAQRKGFLTAALPTNWAHCIKWAWPKMREVDSAKEQSAIAAKFRNGLLTFEEMIGPDWEEHLDRVAADIAECNKRGITHPSQVTVAGAVITDTETTKEENDNESDNGTVK